MLQTVFYHFPEKIVSQLKTLIRAFYNLLFALEYQLLSLLTSDENKDVVIKVYTHHIM